MRWGKVKVLSDVLNSLGHDFGAPDFFLYMDVDVAMADFSKDSFAPLMQAHREAEILLSREPAVKASRAAENGANDWSGGRQDFNNGVLLVRNSDWSRGFLAEWARTLLVRRQANDQEVMQELYDADVMGARTKVMVLAPGEVNSEMSSPVGEAGQRVVHLGGIPDAVRAKVFKTMHATVCDGNFLAFGGPVLQEVFLKAMRKEAGLPPPTTKGKAAVNGWLQVRQRLALSLQRLGRKSEALEDMEAVWRGRRELFGPNSRDALAALLHFGHAAGEPAHLLEAWKGFRLLQGDDGQDSVQAAALAAEALLAGGRHEEALEPARAAARGQPQAPGVASIYAIVLNNLGLQRLADGRPAEAESLLRSAVQALGGADVAAEVGSTARQVLDNVARSLEALAQQPAAAAAPLRSELPEPPRQSGSGSGSEVGFGEKAKGEIDHGTLGAQLLLAGADRAEEARRHLEQAAQGGDLAAQANLATLLAQGKGALVADHAQAAHWFGKAAAAGQRVAQYNLFVALASGQGVKQDLAEATRWLRKAAEAGLPQAQVELGAAHAAGGLGLLQDDRAAARWYRRAAKQGDAEAQFRLALLHITGRGVPQDQAKVNRLYLKAATQGHVTSQVNLGMVHRFGYGVPRNGTEAALWFRRAAEQDSVEAQFSLGEMLDTSKPIEVGGHPAKDDDEALKWYMHASTKNHTDAQFRVGRMLVQGRGCKRNRAEALRWLNAAGAAGHALAAFQAAQLSAAPAATPVRAVVARPLPAVARPWPETLAAPAPAPVEAPSVYRPWPQCPFMNIDIVIYTGLRDAAMLATLLASVKLFMPCFRRLRAVVPAAEIPAVQPLLVAAVGERLRLHAEAAPEWLVKVPWVWRIAYTFFFMDVIAQADDDGAVVEHVLLLDTDVVLAYPVTCRDLFEPLTGRAWAYYWPHIFRGNLANTQRLFNATSDAQRVGSFMTYFPQLYPVEVFGWTRDRLQAAYRSVTFEEAFRLHATVGNLDFVDLFFHAAYFHPRGHDLITFVSCPPAAAAARQLQVLRGGAAPAGDRVERCVNAAHVGVHVPYEWHHCVSHDGPVCSHMFPKFERQPMEGELGLPSEQFLVTASEIMHRGLCFAHRHYGQEGGVPASCRAALLRGMDPVARDGSDVHWRVWTYTNGQGGLPLRSPGEKLSEIVETDRLRSTCRA